MKNSTLALIAGILCLILGCFASYLAAFTDLSSKQLIISSILGMSCLPLGIFIFLMAYREREAELNTLLNSNNPLVKNN